MDEQHPFCRDRTHFHKETKVTINFGGYKSGETILHDIISMGYMKLTEEWSKINNSMLLKHFGWHKKTIFGIYRIGKIIY